MELRVLLLLGLTITSSAGFSLPVSRPWGGSAEPRPPAPRPQHGERGEAGPAAGLPAAGGGEAPRRRAKRCTCYTYKDKECVYYCHLDIIWINTPERTVPYGLSNYRSSFRGKRSTSHLQRNSESSEWSSFRCSCLDTHDKQCLRFCTRSQDTRSNQVSLKRTSEEEHHRRKEQTLIK